MSLICRIDGIADLPIIKGKIITKLDAIATCDVTLPLRYGDITNTYLRNAQIIDEGVNLFDGFVFKSPKVKLTDNKATLVSLRLHGNLGRLACVRAVYDVHIQNKSVIGSLVKLLELGTNATTGNWLVETVGVVDLDVMTTIDLRTKETLFGQITALLSNVPQLHFRFGGIDRGGNYILQVGDFNALTSHAQKGANLLSLSLTPNSQEVIQEIYPTGALTTDQIITVEQAFTSPDYLGNPLAVNYPISQSSDGAWVVTNNNTLGFGCTKRKTYPLTKTSDDTPTPTEIEEASVSLWLRAVKDLQASEPYDTWSLSIADKTPPLIGDRIFINGQFSEPAYDLLQGACFDDVVILDVHDDYRIMQVTNSLDRGVLPALVEPLLSETNRIYQVEATGNDAPVESDITVQLYKRLQPEEVVEPSTFVLTFLGIVHEAILSHDGFSASDCQDGKLFEIPQSAIPIGATEVLFTFGFNRANVSFEVVSIPNLVGDNLILCCSVDGGWDVNTPSLEVSVTYFYL